MRKTIASFIVAASLCGGSGMARAEDPGRELTYSAVATFTNLFYTPAKVLVAAVGLPLGAIAGTLGGGDTRSAYAFWVPMIGGTYFLTSDQMDGDAPVEFFGSDYADRPGMYGRSHHGSVAYDAVYHGAPAGSGCNKAPCDHGGGCAGKN